MTPVETAKLLTAIAAFDNRKPDPATVLAWHETLGEYRYEDCRDAVSDYFRNSREWLMPSDIISRVTKARAARVTEWMPDPPAELDPDDTAAYAAWLKRTRQQVADGQIAPPPTAPLRSARDVGELGVAGRRVA